MKKIKILLAFLTTAFLINSCASDGGTSNFDVQTGAVPNILKISSTDAFINLVGIQNGQTIDLGLTVSVAQGDVKSMDIVLYYLTGTKVYKGTLLSNITTFPKEIHISQTDLINVFSELNSNQDFKLGDQLKVSALLTLQNGTVLNMLNDQGGANYGQDIANSAIYKVSQSYFVSCPSDLAGTYSVLSSGESTDSGPTPAENPITNFPYTVVITAKGGGAYSMSDGYGGLYQLWYDIYGITRDYPGTFNDVCNTLSGTFGEPFGTDVNITGTVNANGTLTIRWENGFQDFGVGTYTKQ